MAETDDLMDDQLVGCWYNIVAPHYGYVKIFPYSHEYNGGDAIVAKHATHSTNEDEPLMWHRGVWKPTDLGYEIIAGPYHFKDVAVFSRPETPNGPRLLYFRCHLNGWGMYTMGKLPDNDESAMLDKLKGIPEYQEEITYWKDHPADRFEHNRKYLTTNRRLEPRDQRKKRMAKEGITEPEQGAPWTPVAGKRSGTGPGASEGGPAGDGSDKGKGDDSGKANAPQDGGEHKSTSETKSGDSKSSEKSEGKPADQEKKPAPAKDDSKSKSDDDGKKKSGSTWDRDGDGNVLDDVVTGRFLKGKKDEPE